MIRKLMIVLAATLCFSAAARASELDALLEGIHSMKADFVQTIFDNRGKAIQKSYGQMALARPGKFRWQTSKPVPQLIIANGARLWIYDPDLEQVTIRALHKAAGDSPALLLSHENAQIDHDYTVKRQQNKAGVKLFTLTPRDSDSVFEKVEMGFSGAKLIEMRLKDHIGHDTHIQFKNAQTNVALSESLFIFKKSANVDVIDETRRNH